MEFLAPLVVVLIILAAIFSGVFIGVSITHMRYRHVAVGRLRIDHSEPDEPTRLFAELKGVSPDMLARNKFVMFEVIDESYLYGGQMYE